jgi:VIT1/CCC1 family predicted Fe2+/Mn2+ transporter
MNRDVLKFQKSEITEHLVYAKLANATRDKNKAVLEKIAAEELCHYNEFKKYTGTDIKPDMIRVYWYAFIGRALGITFAAKLMENSEVNAAGEYEKLKGVIENIEDIIKDEKEHEAAMIRMIDEEKLGYISSMVLGLNDAIVELTGALAGFTFALQNTKVIGVAGLITGIAAALSMSAAEYLSQKSEKSGKSPLKAAFYTGIVYIAVVIVLVVPYFIVADYHAAFGFTLIGVMCVILLFSFFVSVVKDEKFNNIFWEMTIICLGVSLVAFLIGLGARKFLNIQI